MIRINLIDSKLVKELRILREYLKRKQIKQWELYQIPGSPLPDGLKKLNT